MCTNETEKHDLTNIPFHSTYEILKPEDFGMSRYVSIGHRLTGWNAVKNRIEQLQLTDLKDEDAKIVTQKIKELADIRPLSLDDVDTMLHHYHSAKSKGAHKHFLDNIGTPDQIADILKNTGLQ